MIFLTTIEDSIEPISRIFIDLGFFTWYKYSLMIMIGIFTAAFLGFREGKLLGIKSDDIIDGLLIFVPLSIIGTRIWYVIFEWDSFNGDILKMIDITDGGLIIYGAVVVVVIGVYFYSKKRNLNLLSVLDLVAPGFLIAQALGRWGNFFNQEAYGTLIGGLTDGVANLSLIDQRAFLSSSLHLPDFITNQMYIFGPNGSGYYHPIFLYESLWNLVGFGFILIWRRTRWAKNGDMIGIYMLWYGIIRILIEPMRVDANTMMFLGNEIYSATLISVVMIIGALGYFILLRTTINSKSYLEVIEEQKNS
jgi:phosphatidylglycerol:prolipoprotein diacylglycerol transferase